MPVLWFTYLPILPITISFCQTKTTLSPLYSRFCRLLSLKTHRRLFAALYIPKSQPYRVFGMQNTVTRYQDVRKRRCVVFFFPWLKERLRLSLRVFCLGFRAFSASTPEVNGKKTLLCALSRYLPYIAFCLPDGCSRIVIFTVALFPILSSAQKVQSV